MSAGWLSGTTYGSTTASLEARDPTPPVWRRGSSRSGRKSSVPSSSCRARTASSTCTSTASWYSRSRCSVAIRTRTTSRHCCAPSSAESSRTHQPAMSRPHRPHHREGGGHPFGRVTASRARACARWRAVGVRDKTRPHHQYNREEVVGHVVAEPAVHRPAWSGVASDRVWMTAPSISGHSSGSGTRPSRCCCFDVRFSRKTPVSVPARTPRTCRDEPRVDKLGRTRRLGPELTRLHLARGGTFRARASIKVALGEQRAALFPTVRPPAGPRSAAASASPRRAPRGRLTVLQ